MNQHRMLMFFLSLPFFFGFQALGNERNECLQQLQRSRNQGICPENVLKEGERIIIGNQKVQVGCFWGYGKNQRYKTDEDPCKDLQNAEEYFSNTIGEVKELLEKLSGENLQAEQNLKTLNRINLCPLIRVTLFVNSENQKKEQVFLSKHEDQKLVLLIKDLYYRSPEIPKNKIITAFQSEPRECCISDAEKGLKYFPGPLPGPLH